MNNHNREEGYTSPRVEGTSPRHALRKATPPVSPSSFDHWDEVETSLPHGRHFYVTNVPEVSETSLVLAREQELTERYAELVSRIHHHDEDEKYALPESPKPKVQPKARHAHSKSSSGTFGKKGPKKGKGAHVSTLKKTSMEEYLAKKSKPRVQRVEIPVDDPKVVFRKESHEAPKPLWRLIPPEVPEELHSAYQSMLDTVPYDKSTTVIAYQEFILDMVLNSVAPVQELYVDPGRDAGAEQNQPEAEEPWDNNLGIWDAPNNFYEQQRNFGARDEEDDIYG